LKDAVLEAILRFVDSRDRRDARRALFSVPRSSEDSIREDIERYVGAPPERHARDLETVCRMVSQTLQSRPDRAAVLAFQDPRSPEAERLWLRRFRESRREPGGE
jgi:hypothetical protein